MNKAVVKEGRANWHLLQQFVEVEEKNDPELKRRGERFRTKMNERQARNLALIMSNPDSKAYRDHILTPARFGVPVPTAIVKVAAPAPRTARHRTTKRELAKA